MACALSGLFTHSRLLDHNELRTAEIYADILTHQTKFVLTFRISMINRQMQSPGATKGICVKEQQSQVITLDVNETPQMGLRKMLLLIPHDIALSIYRRLQ